MPIDSGDLRHVLVQRDVVVAVEAEDHPRAAGIEEHFQGLDELVLYEISPRADLGVQPHELQVPVDESDVVVFLRRLLGEGLWALGVQEPGPVAVYGHISFLQGSQQLWVALMSVSAWLRFSLYNHNHACGTRMLLKGLMHAAAFLIR